MRKRTMVYRRDLFNTKTESVQAGRGINDAGTRHSEKKRQEQMEWTEFITSFEGPGTVGK